MADCLEKYISIADNAGACSEYMAKLRACRSKRQAIDVALHGGAVGFLGKLLATEAISVSDFARDFSQFANGAYRSQLNGYSSALWIGEDRATITETCNLVVNCREIAVETFICEIHIAGRLPEMTGKGCAHCYYHLPDGSISKFRYNGV